MIALKNLSSLSILALLSLSTLCYVEAGNAQQEIKEADKKNKSEGSDDNEKAKKTNEAKKTKASSDSDKHAPQNGGNDAHGYDSNKYWDKVKLLHFSEGILTKGFNKEENPVMETFDEDTLEYTLLIRNPKTTYLEATVQLDRDKYNKDEFPLLEWDGPMIMSKEDKTKSPHDTEKDTREGKALKFRMNLSTSPDEFSGKEKLTCKADKKNGVSREYTIHFTQVPDIENIVAAKNIRVQGLKQDGTKVGDESKSPRKKDNEIVFYVNSEVDKVRVTVECPAEAKALKYNGEKAAKLDSTHESGRIEGASKSIFAQCVYKHDRWTNGEDLQHTYVIKILRNHDLKGAKMDIRVWPPREGLCKSRKIVPESDGDGDDKTKAGDEEFLCMGYDPESEDVPLLAQYSEDGDENGEKAELVVEKLDDPNAKYRLWNGIPSHVPINHHEFGPKSYRLVLKAGQFTRTYGFRISRPQKCRDHVACEEKNWRTSSEDSINFCNWETCDLKTDFDTCCEKKRATCGTYKKCKENKNGYRKANLHVCPVDDKDDVDEKHPKFTYNENTDHYYHYNGEDWDCKKEGKKEGKNLSFSAASKCSWTPCIEEDIDHCCVKKSLGSCSSMKRPKDMALSADEEEKYCPKDMALRSESEDKHCLEAQCSPKDVETCCTTRDVCTSMTCSNGYGLRMNAMLHLCAGEKCEVKIDHDTCCTSSAYCDTFTCPPLWESKKDASTRPCGLKKCIEYDTGLCCNRQGMCSTLECPVGYFKRDDAEGIPCTDTRSCNLGLDLHTCCERNAVCSESSICNKAPGYKLKVNAQSFTCPGAECTKTDLNLCCDMVNPFKAATGITLIPASGNCHKVGDEAWHFSCSTSGTSLHLKAKLTFDRPVGNEISHVSLSDHGETAEYDLPEINAPEGGKKYTLTMKSRVSGRGVAEQKIILTAHGTSTSDGGTYRKLSSDELFI